MAANDYIKGFIMIKFNSFIKLLGIRVFKKETVYRVKSIAFYLSSLLKSARHPLFLTSSILRVL